MNEQATAQCTVPFAFYSAQGKIPTPPAGKSELLEFTNEKNGATLATGLVTFNELETAPWTIWYDEVLSLHSVEGAFEIEFDGKSHPMKVGDFIWVRAGSTVVYRARGGAATLFYAVVPADWVARGRPT